MQEKPYPPLHDYVRVVSHGTSITNKVTAKNDYVWVCCEKNGKFTYERKKSGTGITVDSSVANYIGINTYGGASSDIKIFDASKSESLTCLRGSTASYSDGMLSLGKTVELIDLTGCSKLKLLKLRGYNNNYETTNCNEIRINGCTSATILEAYGQGSSPRIYGLLECTNLENIYLYGIAPAFDDGSRIDNLDLRGFDNLKSLNFSYLAISSLDLPISITSLRLAGCSNLVLDVEHLENLTTLVWYKEKYKDNKLIAPASLKTYSGGEESWKSADLSKCSNLSSFSAYSKTWAIGGLIVNPSIKSLSLGTSWGKWVYPIPDLTDCVNLTSINCQNCKNIPNLDQQAFIDSLPTFTDGSTHTINLNNTGVVADTVAAIQAKGWTVQV